MGIFNEPGGPGLAFRGGRQRFPSGVVGSKHAAALEYERGIDVGIHIVIGTASAFPREDIGGGEAGTGQRRVGFIGKNHMGDVEARKVGLKESLVLPELGDHVGAGQSRAGMIVGMVEDIPSCRSQGLQGCPIHIVIAAPGSSARVGPGSYNRRPGPPAQRIQKRFAVFVLGEPAIVKGEGVGPMKIIVERGLGSRARPARCPILRGHHDGFARGSEHGCSGGGIVGGACHRGPVGRDRHGGAGAHVDDQGDLLVITQGRDSRLIDVHAIIFVGRPGWCNRSKEQGQW